MLCDRAAAASATIAKCIAPRGKVLGGSSSINGMIYIRGQAEDFDHWRQLGNAGWSFDDVLPYFRKAEDNERGADQFHGAGGPLGVSDAARRAIRSPRPMSRRRSNAAIRATTISTARVQEGAGYYQTTMRNGVRCVDGDRLSASRRAARRTRGGAGGARDADSVRGAPRGRRRVSRAAASGAARARTARSSVAAGAFNSPQLLQLSGVGPAALLQTLGIAVVADAARRRREAQRPLLPAA